jgi:drug/metabolite transporter (DMT)-like permease
LVNNQLLGVILALIAAIAWGSASILYKIVLKSEYPLVFSVTIRGLFAVPLIALFTLFITGFKSVEALFYPEIFPILMISSITVGVADLMFFGAIQRMEVSKIQPIASIYPLFSAIFLILSQIEAISLIVFMGTVIIIFGMGLVAQQNNSTSSISGSNLKKNNDIAILLAIGAAFFWGIAIFTLRLILDHPQIEVLSLATIRFGILTIIVGLFWFFMEIRPFFSKKAKESSFSIMSLKDMLILGIGGIIAWGFGGISFFWSVDIIGAAKATPISSINPFITVILGIFFLKEKLSPIQMIGVLFVCLGSIFISIS